MKESYGEGLAAHAGPESCVDSRKGIDEALTGVRAGWVFSRVRKLRGADAVKMCGRPHPLYRYRETQWDLARSETPRMYGNMYGNISRENREILCSSMADGVMDCIGKSKDTRR
jgi:hypothetical protein